jgi:lipoyl-dependent peroxiredoxin
MTQSEKIVYTAKVHTTGGREGASRSDDDQLSVRLSRPGSAQPGTNPEQLFAAGWSSCFESAMALAARAMKIALPTETAIDAEVDLGTDQGGYFLRARFNISIPGVDPATARHLVEEAHRLCPYSRATRGNVELALNLI